METFNVKEFQPLGTIFYSEKDKKNTPKLFKWFNSLGDQRQFYEVVSIHKYKDKVKMLGIEKVPCLISDSGKYYYGNELVDYIINGAGVNDPIDDDDMGKNDDINRKMEEYERRSQDLLQSL